MRKVTFRRSGLTTSRLGFGTSRLHWCDPKLRRRLIDAAIDTGIVHFDTAPAYGDTIAEAALGSALAGRRDKIVLATKYGLPADPLISALPAFSMPLRALRAVSRRVGKHPPSPPIDASGLVRSLQMSLRRMRCDHVDLLLLHEPSKARIPDLEQLKEVLAEIKSKGLARYVGLAGAWTGIAELGDWADSLAPVVQTSEREWPPGCLPDITYGALSAGPQSFMAKSAPLLDPEERLLDALRRRPEGCVLISTTKPERLCDLVTAAERAP